MATRTRQAVNNLFLKVCQRNFLCCEGWQSPSHWLTSTYKKWKLVWDRASFLSLKARGWGKGIETSTTFDNSPCNSDFGDTGRILNILLVILLKGYFSSYGDAGGILYILLAILDGYWVFSWWYWRVTEYFYGDTGGILIILLSVIVAKHTSFATHFLAKNLLWWGEWKDWLTYKLDIAQMVANLIL